MNKNNFAPLPPMGWNSYDYYDTTVTEDAVKANADYMAAHLKEFGWEYIVVDIEWYAIGAGSMRDQFQYIPFADVAMDEFSDSAGSGTFSIFCGRNRFYPPC